MAELDMNLMKSSGDLRVISVTSGKGGVGKSSIILNLALALGKKGKKVMILDADMGLANVDIMLGVKPLKDLSDVLNGKCALKDIIVRGPYGIMLIPGGTGFSQFTNLNSIQKMTLLNEFENFEEDVEFLLVDTAAGISSNVLFFNSCSSEVIVVVNPEPTSITDSYALIKVLSKEHNVNKFSLLINNVATDSEARRVYGKIAKVSERFLNVSLNYIGYLPQDRSLGLSIREQNPLLNRSKVTPYVVRLNELCHEVLSAENEEKVSGNLQFFFKRMVELSA